jgi:ABC-type antimicrobial peptide transport system permease subunit
MIRFALRGLADRKLRATLTAIAIVLGVAMVSGTYVLTDSISKAFDAIFTQSYRGTDAVITGKSAFDLGESGAASAPSFDESLLPKVRAVDDVRDAIGGVEGEAQLIGPNGKAIVFGGAPNLGFSVDPTRPSFNSLTLVGGAWPKANEVVIDQATARKKDLVVGQEIGVQAEGPVEKVRISGLVKFGAVETIGGATLAGFDLRTAQHLFDKVGKLDDIRVAGKPGVAPAKLVASIEPVLPSGTEIRTGNQQATKDAEDTSSFISFLQKFLLAFGGIALFVGAFVIANSLSITIAQRTREFATLRTLGASRRQVLGAVVVEALVLGIFASVAGLILGLALAKGLFKLFDAVGFTLPNQGLTLEPRTIIVSLAVGIIVTLLASLRPAMRATRVPPIAAVREGATLPPGRFHRFRLPGAVLTIAAGFAALLYGLFGSGLGTTQVLLWMGVGALLVFIGVALFSSHIVVPMAYGASPVARWSVFLLAVLFWPFWTLPYWLLRYGAFGTGGAAGKRILAFVGGALLNPFLLLIVLVMWIRRSVSSWRPEWPVDFPGVIPDRVTSTIGGENARRNPQRTASTASALMIGLALVTLVATLAAGIINTFTDAVDEIFTSDYAVTAQNNFSPLPASVGEAVARTPGRLAVGSVRAGDGRAFGNTIQVTAVTPESGKVLRLTWKQGSQAVFAQLGADGAFVDDGYAKRHDLRLGSPLQLLTPRGKTLDLRIKGIFDPPSGGSPFGAITISSATFDANNDQPKDLFTFVKMEGGVTDANTAALEKSIDGFPNAKAATREQFVDNQISGLKSILNILYVLLALSILVSLFGIVNTLVLTVFERTRELGMLRAVGMTRRQTRRMIRHESVITALIGAVVGMILGIVLAGLLIARVDFITFAVPWFQILVFTIAAIVVGIIAAIFPARRAAKLDPLQALQYE